MGFAVLIDSRNLTRKSCIGWATFRLNYESNLYMGYRKAPSSVAPAGRLRLNLSLLHLTNDLKFNITYSLNLIDMQVGQAYTRRVLSSSEALNKFNRLKSHQ